jgi:hypothetical protein
MAKRNGKPAAPDAQAWREAAKELFPDVQLSGGPQATKKRAFLMALAESGQMRLAAAVGISHYLPHLWAKRDPGFAEALELAKSMAIETIEAQAFELAAHG